MQKLNKLHLKNTCRAHLDEPLIGDQEATGLIPTGLATFFSGD